MNGSCRGSMRAAVEDRLMQEDAELKSQIETLWLAQNEAIRAAFPSPPDSGISTAAGESAPRSVAAELASPSSQTHVGSNT